MRWAVGLVGLALACVAAPWLARAQLLPMCVISPPGSGYCAAGGAAVAGSACLCAAGGASMPGRVFVPDGGRADRDWLPNAAQSHQQRSSGYSRGIRPSLPSAPDTGAAAAPAPTPSPGPLAPAPWAPVPTAKVVPVPAQPSPTTSSRSLQPARALRPGNAIPDAGVGAYGVVALAATATPDTQARLGRLCRAFLASLPPQSSLPASVALADQMLTYWPVSAPSAEQCGPMLANYDLFAGQKAIRDAAAHRVDVRNRGPYLIGWSPSASREVPDAVVLVLDLSDLESERSFTDAFQFWQERVVGDPSLWRNGFSMFLVQRAARDFADHYGTDILKALHLVSSEETK